MPNEEERFQRVNGLAEDFLDEIDRELENLVLPPEAIDTEDIKTLDVADTGVEEMRETYVAMVRNFLSPIDRYMKALSSEENFRDVLEISELIVTPLIPKTEAVGLNEHADDLTFFRSLLVLALGERDQVGMNAMLEVVMEGFSKLSERFGLSYRGYRIAVRNLVRFYRNLRTTEGVSAMDVRKFFAIGVPSLSWIRKTKPEELSSLSGIDLNIVREIRKLAFLYRSAPSMAAASLAKDELVTEPQYDEIDEPDQDRAQADIFDADVFTDVELKTAPRGSA